MQDRPPGALGTLGVDQIETRFTASIVPSGKHALVDLSGVTFLSSMGIRMLVATALAPTADARASVCLRENTFGRSRANSGRTNEAAKSGRSMVQSVGSDPVLP